MKTDILPMEQSNPQTELLAQGASIVRLENFTQMQMSLQRPRDEKIILKSAMEELDIYPSCAEEAIYNKPVGKDEGGQMNYAEGLSIRAAENLANRWDNSAYGCDIISEDDESVTLAAVFLDYERNTRHVIQKKVSKFFKTRHGQIKEHPPDRFKEIIIPANQSKLLREVILRSLPAGLKKEYESKAKKLLGSGNLEMRLKKMITAFKKQGITQRQIEELRGKALKDFEYEDLTEMLGVYNALKDGEITSESLFNERKPGPEEPDLKVK